MPKSPSNQIFDKTSFLHGANATYVEEMFKKYSDDPSSVPNDWGIFFKNIKDEGLNSSTYSVCLLYTSPSPRDMRRSRMPSSA